MRHLFLLIFSTLISMSSSSAQENIFEIKYAKHFSVKQLQDGVKILSIEGAWPNSKKVFEYALIPKKNKALLAKYKEYSCIQVPVERMVLTSTTHIPALVDLNEIESIVGFTGLDLISSKEVRSAIDKKQISELGVNEKINIETSIALNPEVVIGFSISDSNRAYDELRQFGIPIVYNADWVEQSPLAKAEWIKFFGLFFNKEEDAILKFNIIEKHYNEAKELAENSVNTPTVISGSLYKDVWYAPGKDSWAATFLKDANANYLFSDLGSTGSLSLSIEEAILKGSSAEYWIAPAQFTSYESMRTTNSHYEVFNSFKNKKIHTYALTKGETGGMLYFELASHRPDLVLKDLISILHPQLLKDYTPTFFKPLINE